jgi:hypothetical protein
LFIVAVKVHRMSVAQALEFYGPVKEVLRSKLKDMVASKAKATLEKEFGFKLGPQEEQQLGSVLGPVFGDSQFDNIVKFMSGHAPSEISPEDQKKPGPKIHRAGVRRRRSRAEDPGHSWTNRPIQGATRLNPQRIWSDDYG